MDLGYILIAFVCMTPADVPDGTHDCLIGTYGHYMTDDSCINAAIRLTEDIEEVGGRIPEGACRTPIPSDGDLYTEAVIKTNSI